MNKPYTEHVIRADHMEPAGHPVLSSRSGAVTTRSSMNTMWSALTVAVTVFSISADATCRRGRPIPLEEQQWNASPRPLAAQELEKHKHLPSHFNWCNVKDRSTGTAQTFCSASWGQHDETLVKATYCGACWVHGTLSAIQDRLKIAKAKKGKAHLDTMLSRQTMLNCGAFEGNGAGCDGGDPIDVFRYMAKFGLPDSTCQSYTASDHTRWANYTVDGHCPPQAFCSNCMPTVHHGAEVDECWGVQHPPLYFVSGYGRIEGDKRQQEKAMMLEIYSYGPIVCSIATPEDFTYGYRRGVYNDTQTYTEADIDHNVEVVGWGREHHQDFWIVRNSWGSYWGEMGFFRIPRGSNSLMLENGDCWWADVTWDDEQAVQAGKLAGSMYGLVEVKEKGEEKRPAEDGGTAGIQEA